MSDIEGLFAPIPSRVTIQPQIVPEIQAEVPKKITLWWLPSYTIQFYSIITILVIGIVYLLWYTSKQAPVAEDVVQKIKTAAASLELPTMADLDAMPKLHINSVKVEPEPEPQPQPQIFTGNLTNPDNLKELGTWMRDGLTLRKVAPDVITHILTFTVRSILQKSDPKIVAPSQPAPVIAPVVVQEPEPVKPKPVGGKIDIKGKPIPVYEDQTVAGVKEGKINAELDPRIIAMLKSREVQST
jgi:hypothetical protein